MAMDLANYINESMLDNAYPEKNGVAWYLDNCMTVEESHNMSKVYLQCYYEKYMKTQIKEQYKNSDEFVDTNIKEFMS